MSKFTYLERMELLEKVDGFHEYFLSMANVCSEHKHFDRAEFNKAYAVLLEMIRDVKS